MKNIFSLVLFSFLLIVSCNKANYTQVWADEFNYSGPPDSTKWDYNIGGHGWGNKELQHYTNRLENAEVKEGKLFITAIKSKNQNVPYTSARLTTKSTNGHWKYGRIEASIKLPYGQGIWPAFWMLGTNIDEVRWPACGEIDIMEMVGGKVSDNKSHGTLHWKNPEGKHEHKGSTFSLESGILNNNFHRFRIDWDPEKINWYVDDDQIHSMDISTEEFSAFQEEFFILLNLAVGGRWPGYPDSTTVFPQKMEVDYVRVYQKSQY